MRIKQMIIHSNLSQMKDKILPTCLKESYTIILIIIIIIFNRCSSAGFSKSIYNNYNNLLHNNINNNGNNNIYNIIHVTIYN